MGTPALDSEKMIGIKGSVDRSRLVHSGILPKTHLPEWKRIMKRIFAWLGVMMDGLYYRELLNHFEIPDACDPCRYWKSCPGKAGRDSRASEKIEDPQNGDYPHCPIYIWLRGIIE